MQIAGRHGKANAAPVGFGKFLKMLAEWFKVTALRLIISRAKDSGVDGQSRRKPRRQPLDESVHKLRSEAQQCLFQEKPK